MATYKTAKTHFIPTSQLKLYDVVNDRGEDLGQVQNFILDMCSARIAYVLVAFEGFLGLTDKWIPIPFEVLDWEPTRRRFETDISRKMLEKAPTISKSDWPDKFLMKLELADHSEWLESVYKYYNCTPYWAVEGRSCGTGVPAETVVAVPLMETITIRPVTIETVTITEYVNPQPQAANKAVQPESPSSAKTAAIESIKAATAAEEAAKEAMAAKEAKDAACAAAARAEAIAKAQIQASEKANQEAEMAKRQAAEAIRKAEETARRAEDAARSAKASALDAVRFAEEADRRAEAAGRKAGDTARSAKTAANEDAARAEEASIAARQAASAAARNFDESETCSTDSAATMKTGSWEAKK